MQPSNAAKTAGLQKSANPNPTRPRVWLSWSSGKDCYAALRELLTSAQYDVAGLFTIVDSDSGQIPMHAVDGELLRQQVEALGLSHHPVRLGKDNNDSVMTALLEDAKQAGVEFVAFGDLFLEDVRQVRETNMAGTGVGTLFPLWKKPTEALILDLIQSGMRAIITSVDLSRLPVSFLGRELTPRVVSELVAAGCDPCGENGEIHTFVFDGPLFSEPVGFERGTSEIGSDFAHLPLRPAPG